MSKDEDKSIRNANEQLVACPFCGHKAHICEHKFNGIPSITYGVVCASCGAMSNQFFSTMGEAVAAWNTRKEVKRVAPVVRGEWDEIERGGLLNKYVLFRCTHCGNIFKVYEDTLNAGRGDKNFCPNCGADMRGKE